MPCSDRSRSGDTHSMSAEYATFGLAPAMRAGGVLANGDYQVHRDFIDFIVDGRPLLHQLSDLDAVSPLASDVPPAIFTAQVRGLLLEADAPLAGGRYVIYGCPECADLACGAVTAVIERDGDDYVWRDFAWQTDPHADLELNGYHGIGPFRFRGAEYRDALGSLLDTAEAAEAAHSAESGRPPPGPADRRPGRRPRQARRRAAHHRHRRGHHPRRHGRPRRRAARLRRGRLRPRGRRGGACRRAPLLRPRRASRWRTSTASPRSSRSSSPRSNTPWTAARRNSAGSPAWSPADGEAARGGHLDLPGAPHRVPPRPPVPHPHARGLRRHPRTGPAPHRPGRRRR